MMVKYNGNGSRFSANRNIFTIFSVHLCMYELLLVTFVLFLGPTPGLTANFITYKREETIRRLQ